YNMLMLMGTTVAGAMLAKSAVVATKLNAAGEGNSSFNNNKIITAKFFAQHVMPRNSGYLEAVKAGDETVMALDIEGF
ncbi:MAG: acyl-CoA dehydrogenase C-terminal domain-containing protein, partial [Porticoccus sp.]|nr:acyl-CoA dehydrogenase C-terminal domain-containing protein [Porticoccus sp.]